MKPRRSPILLLGILVAAGSFALGAETSEPELLSVRIVPETVELERAGAARQLLVMGGYSDRLERDVTSLIRWEFSNGAVARVSTEGRAEALAEGVTDVTARLGARSATVRLRVKGGGRRPPLSFTWDVEKILTRRGCNDTHCHGGVKGRGGFKLSLYGIYPREDYRWIVKGGTYQVLSPDPGTEIPRIDLKEPEKSLLLRKPTLAEPHQGGLQLPLESEDYRTLLRVGEGGSAFSAGGILETRGQDHRGLSGRGRAGGGGRTAATGQRAARGWDPQGPHRPGALPGRQQRGGGGRTRWPAAGIASRRDLRDRPDSRVFHYRPDQRHRGDPGPLSQSSRP